MCVSSCTGTPRISVHRKLCDRCRLPFVRVTALGKPPRCQARAPGSPSPWPQRRPDLGSLSWCWQGNKASQFLETFPHRFFEITLNPDGISEHRRSQKLLAECRPDTRKGASPWPDSSGWGSWKGGGVTSHQLRRNSTLGSDEKATVPTKSPFLPLLSECWAQ